MGVSANHFATHVEPYVAAIAGLGEAVRFDVQDLDGWIDSRKRAGHTGSTCVRDALENMR